VVDTTTTHHTARAGSAKSTNSVVVGTVAIVGVVSSEKGGGRIQGRDDPACSMIVLRGRKGTSTAWRVIAVVVVVQVEETFKGFHRGGVSTCSKGG